MKTKLLVRALSLILVLLAGLGLYGAHLADANRGLPGVHGRLLTWTGAGGDGRWSNSENWQDGQVPGSEHAVRIAADAGDMRVDADFAGVIGSLTIEPGYAGTLTLGRGLSIGGDLIMSGGNLVGGDAPLAIAGSATVSGGVLTTPSSLMSVKALAIHSSGIVRLGTNGKLNLTGDGTPLTGDGLLDVTTNTPNSVEYTGHAQSNLTAAEPATAFHALARKSSGRRMGKLPGGASAKSGDILPSANVAFTETSSLSFDAGDGFASSAVIDTGNGFAYFGAGYGTGPGVVIKVRLSDFTRVGTLTLNAGESFLRSAVIDTINGFAYFGTGTSPGIVAKVRLSDFTRVGALTLNAGEENLTSAVMDTANGFAYFGTGCNCNLPGLIVKVSLSDFSRVGALTLNSDEVDITSAVIDSVRGFAYFGTTCRIDMPPPGSCSTLSKVVMIRLLDFTRAGALTMNGGEGSLGSAVIDPPNGFAYFGAHCTTYHCGLYGPSADVVKVRLSDLTRAGTLVMNPGEGPISAAVIDPAKGFAYFSAACDFGCSTTGAVVKIRLSDFTRVGTIGAAGAWAAVIDAMDGFAYFGTADSPGQILKVRLSDFTQTGALNLNAAENSLTSAVIDTANGFAYFGTDTFPGVIVKLRLSDFTRVGALVLNGRGGEYNLKSAVIDATNGFAYFGTDTSPGVIVKVRLSDFSRVSALTLSNSGEDYLTCAVIDPANGFAYFGGPAGTVVKVRLSDFTRVGTLASNAGDGYLASAVIDVAYGFAYLGMDSGVVKVRLSDFTRVGVLVLNPGAARLTAAVIDSAGGFAYFGTDTLPGIIKVRLSDFTRVGALTLNAGEDRVTSAVIDTARGFAYFGTNTFPTAPGKVVKVRLSDLMRVGALTVNAGNHLLASAVIDSANGFAYVGTSVLLPDLAPASVVKLDVTDLGFTGRVNRAVANLGDGVSYTLNIANDTRDTASGLVLTDTLPTSMTVVSVTPGQPTCNLSSGQVICDLGVLAAGAATEITIDGTVTSSASGVMTNTADISVSEPRFSAPDPATLTTLINPLSVYLPVAARP